MWYKRYMNSKFHDFIIYLTYVMLFFPHSSWLLRGLRAYMLTEISHSVEISPSQTTLIYLSEIYFSVFLFPGIRSSLCTCIRVLQRICSKQCHHVNKELLIIYFVLSKWCNSVLQLRLCNSNSNRVTSSYSDFSLLGSTAVSGASVWGLMVVGGGAGAGGGTGSGWSIRACFLSLSFITCTKQ